MANRGAAALPLRDGDRERLEELLRSRSVSALAENPRFVVHFTPTHASWMNLVEVWFSLIERQAIHRGVYGSVKDLNAKIRAYIDGWNDRAHPFVWTKTADQILKKAKRNATSNAGH